MLVHHCGNHGGAGAKDGNNGGGGFTGRGHADGRGGGRGEGGRVLKAELRLRKKTWPERAERKEMVQQYCENKMYHVPLRQQNWVSRLTFSMPSLVMPTPLSPVFEMVSVSIPVSVPPSFTCPQKVVFPGLGWTLHTHSSSVPAGAHLQSHRAQTLQSHPIILRSGQGVQGPVGEQPSSSLSTAGAGAPVASTVSAGPMAL